ncbi:MAG: hypothetical protein ACXAAH_18030, partial [Promethearchaeota archaeon]
MTADYYEFWLRMDGAEDVGSTDRFQQIHFRKSDNTVSGDRADIDYHDGSNWVEFADCEDTIWYRHRIDFNCTNSKYSWYIYQADGSLYTSIMNLNFENSMATLDEIYFTSITSHYRGATFWDAFGFNWEDNYNIGDNQKEGLLLKFDTVFSPDWKAYSLDGLGNVSILGNTTINFPNGGTHTIQVFGNDSIGALYESDIRYFSVKPISIITPENITYTSPMSGYYPATFGFENDIIGSNPSNWTLYGSGGTVNVISDIGGHYNSLEFHDTSGAGYVAAEHNFEVSRDTDGDTIEFWWRTTDSIKTGGVTIYNDGKTEYMTEIRIMNGYFKYNDGGIWKNLIECNNDQWYHSKIVIDFTNKEFDWIIDDTFNQTNIPFRYVTVDNIRSIYIGTSYAQSSYYNFFDAFGYSWDPNYNVGDNLDEGLLLSYENIFTLDWMGYSLDGLANKTIFGNTTIPFPSEGLHT